MTKKAVGIVLFTALLSCSGLKASNDSLTLAQAFINLSLTEEYFDTLSMERLSKIIPFLEGELLSINDEQFIRSNRKLYNFSHALLYYNKAKFLFRSNDHPNREELLQWKNTLDKAAGYFNASLEGLINYRKNPYYEFIRFKASSFETLDKNIHRLNNQFTPFFNRNIYPDFIRIFYRAKTEHQFAFDSLKYFCRLYSIDYDTKILEYDYDTTLIDGDVILIYKDNTQKRIYRSRNEMSHRITIYRSDDPEDEEYRISFIYLRHPLATALDLISRFLQFQYIAENYNDQRWPTTEQLFKDFDYFIGDLQPADTIRFSEDDGFIRKDGFFNKEMNNQAIEGLQKKMKEGIPFVEDPDIRPLMGAPGPTILKKPLVKYYFPIPAPFPSAVTAVPHFQPGLQTMKQVNDYLKKPLYASGYEGRCHYYYVADGFALTTSLEKINKDGSQLPPGARWNLSAGGDGKFTAYTIFKSIFFATDGNFRVLAFIITPEEAQRSTDKPGFAAISQLLKNSYAALPKDLETFSLPDKTLTILVYNFYQSDIGEVPMLDTRQLLTVRDHLRNTPLQKLLEQ